MVMGSIIADAYGLAETCILRGLRRHYVQPGSALYNDTYFSRGDRLIVFPDDGKGGNALSNIAFGDSRLTDRLNMLLGVDRHSAGPRVRMVRVKEMDDKLAGQAGMREYLVKLGGDFVESLSYKAPPHLFGLVNGPALEFTDIGLGAAHKKIWAHPGKCVIAFDPEQFPFAEGAPSEQAFGAFYKGAQDGVHNYGWDDQRRDMDVSINHSPWGVTVAAMNSARQRGTEPMSTLQ